VKIDGLDAAEKGMVRLDDKTKGTAKSMDLAGGSAKKLSGDLKGVAGQGTITGKILEQQLSGVASRVPLIGQPLAQVTREMFNLGGVSQKNLGAVIKDAEGAAKKLSVLQGEAAKVKELFSTKKGDFAEGLRINFGGKIDTAFLTQFRDAENEAAKLNLLVGKFGSGATSAFQPVERAVFQFSKLERDGTKALTAVEGKVGEAEKTLSGFESQVVSSGGALTGLAGPLGIAAAGAIGLGVVAVGAGIGIFKLAQYAADGAGHLYDLSQRTNVEVETLSGLKVALENSGGSLDTFQSGLVFFQKNTEKVNELVATHRDRNNALAQSYKALSIDVSSNETALRSAFTSLSRVKDETQQTALAQRLFRGSAKDVLGVIKESGGDFDAYMQKLRDMGLIISTDVAKKADQFNDTLHNTKLQLEAVERELGEQFLPTVTGVMSQASDAFVRHKDTVSLIVGSIGLYINQEIMQVEILLTALERLAAAAPSANFTGGLANPMLGFKLGMGYAIDQGLRTVPKNYDAGNGVRIDPKTMRPVDPKDYKPSLTINPGDIAGGGGHKGKGGSGESKALRAAKLEMEALEITAQAAKRIYDRRTADEEFYYSNGLKTLDSYVSMRQTLDEEQFQSALKVDLKELEIAQNTAATGKVKENLVSKVNEKIEALYEGHQQALTKIDRDAWLARNAREKQDWQAKIALLEETASGFAAVYQRMAEQGTMSFIEAEQRIGSAQYEILLAQQKAIEKQLSHTAGGTNAAAELEGQLAVQRQKVANFRAAMAADDDEAKRRDIQRQLDYASQLRTITDSITDMEMESADNRLRAVEASTSSVVRAERLRLDFELKAEDLRAQRNRSALERDITLEQVREQNEAQRAKVIEALNNQIVASDQAHYEKRGLLVEDFLNRQREKLREVSDRLADGISGTIKAGFQNGWRGALQEAEKDFFSFLDDIASKLLRAAAFKALKKLFNLETADDSSNGKAGTGPQGGITGAIAKLLGIGSTKKDEATAQITAAVEKSAQETRAGVVSQVSNTGQDITFDADYNTDRIINALQSLRDTMESLRPQQQGFWSGLLGAAVNGAVGALGGALTSRVAGGSSSGGSSNEGPTSAPILRNPDGSQFHTRPRTVGHMLGGLITGPGTSTSDSIGADLSNGEFVLRAAAVRAIGVSALQYMNAAGKLPQHFATGGFVSEGPAYVPPPIYASSTAASSRGGRSPVTVNVTLKPDGQGRIRSRGQVGVEVVEIFNEGRRNS
jgi:hypothetical protein